MKKWFTRGTIPALLLCPAITLINIPLVGAEVLTPAQQEAVQKEVQRILREQGFGGGMTQIDPPSTDLSQPGIDSGKRLEQLSQPRELHKKYDSSMGGSGGLIYARPFVASPKAILGGYSQFEYRNARNQGDASTFDLRRFVPFIYADVSQNVKLASELEIEHGIREGTETEISLEFATVDYLMAEPFNFRGGVILVPLGKFNLLHDAPLRDLTDRPFLDTYIIPTTLSETGLGFYGTFYPTQLSKLDYEIYITTGFNGYDNMGGGCPSGTNPSTCTSRITESNGLKNARQRKTNVGDGFDNNNGKSVTGRIAFSPVLGVEVAGSGYFGTYDPSSKRSLSIWAVDWTLQRGPFEVIGEAAWAYAKNNSWTLTGMPATDPATGRLLPQRMGGYYVQINYHFLPMALTRLAPTHFRQEVSTFTAVVRWEEANTNKDFDGGLGQYQQLTLGLNFRPTEDTVFKTNFQYTPETTNNMSQRIHDTAFLASVATYF